MRYPGGWLGVLRLVTFLVLLGVFWYAGTWQGAHRHFAEGVKQGRRLGWNEGMYTAWNLFLEACIRDETFTAEETEFHCGPVKDL